MAGSCDYVSVYDIKSCYHQISVAPEHRKFLGFSWILNGKKRFFIFKVVPFGICSGPSICKTIFRPLVTKWRSENIPTVLFFDDGVVGGSSYEQCKKASETVFKDLVLCHILPSAEKSCWEPKKSAEWLGHFWNCSDKVVTITDKRVDKLYERISELEKSFPIVSARKVALVVGSLVSMILVLETKVLLYSRYMQTVINFREWENLTWDSPINIDTLDISQEIRREVSFLKENFANLNSRSLVGEIAPHVTIFGDAGAEGVGGYKVEDGVKVEFHAPLPPPLLGTSSTERELYALFYALNCFVNDIKGHKLVYITDSQCTDIVCQKGSPKLNLHFWALKIDEFCRDHKVKFFTTWVPRELNTEADELSKFKDPDNWSIDRRLFEKAETLIQKTFTVDNFASDQNSQCQKFFSRFACPNSAGINAFKFNWFGEVCWLTPPPKLALKSIQHLKDSYSEGVLIVPKWKSLHFWPMADKLFKPYLKGSWEFPGKNFLRNELESSVMGPRFQGAIVMMYYDFRI